MTLPSYHDHPRIAKLTDALIFLLIVEGDTSSSLEIIISLYKGAIKINFVSGGIIEIQIYIGVCSRSGDGDGNPYYALNVFLPDKFDLNCIP